MSHVEMNRELVLSHVPPEGHFVMVNLFRMKEGQRFADFIGEMISASEETLRDTRGELIYSGKAGGEFTTGEINWDFISLVRFSSWEAICHSARDETFVQKLNSIRRKYLSEWKWVYTTSLNA